MFVVQLIIVKCSFANSIVGPWIIRTCVAFGVVGLSWADRLALKTEIANITRILFIFTPEKARWPDDRRHIPPPFNVDATEWAVWG